MLLINNNTWLNASIATIDYDDECAYNQPLYTIGRFWLVTVFGSTISIISICENLTLFILFIRKKQVNMHAVDSIYF
jgi:hypothetical protein